jgi:carbon monoxide dehydrogenase subunit G
MKIEQTVRVSRPVDDVWDFLGDVPIVVSCIPGAELGEKLDDNRYRGSFRLKVGPLTAKIDGEGEVTRDDVAKSGRITGRGNDKRGGSRVAASVLYNVKPDDSGSVLGVSADLELSGPLAQVGRTGIIEDVAKRLTEEFTAALERKLKEAPVASVAGAPPVSGAQAPNITQPVIEFDAGAAVTSTILRRAAAFFAQLFGKRA